MLAWYKSVCLIGSNLAILPIVVRALMLGRWEDAAVASSLFIRSCMYHFCHAAILCIQPLLFMQVMDHVGVWGILLYFFLLSLPLSRSGTLAIWIFMTAVFSTFGSVLVHSMLIPLALLPAAALVYGVRVAWFGNPIRHVDWLYLVMLAFFSAIGLTLYFFSSDVDGDDYWWSHSLWHITIMVGGFFYYEIAIGESIVLKIGLDLVFEDAYEYIAGEIADRIISTELPVVADKPQRKKWRSRKV